MGLQQLIDKLKDKPKETAAHTIAGIITLVSVFFMSTMLFYIGLLNSVDQLAAFIVFIAIFITLHTLIYLEIRKRLE